MGEVVRFPKVVASDGGKTRIKRRRSALMLDRKYGASHVEPDSLVMLHADPEIIEMPCDCA